MLGDGNALLLIVGGLFALAPDAKVSGLAMLVMVAVSAMAYFDLKRS